LSEPSYLHSPGGSVFGGVKLGKVIRKYLLSTDVAQLDPAQNRRRDSKPGECYSACAMAFLGGEYRYLKRGSILGFHRFFWEKRTENDADLAQILSAMEVEYIRSMDVNTELFTVPSQAGRDDVIALAQDDLVRLNVVNNGVKGDGPKTACTGGCRVTHLRCAREVQRDGRPKQ
jgi:hypothetical protein